jgi:hypothetical protein
MRQFINIRGDPPMLEPERFVSGGEYGGSEAESGGLSGIACLKRGENKSIIQFKIV